MGIRATKSAEAQVIEQYPYVDGLFLIFIYRTYEIAALLRGIQGSSDMALYQVVRSGPRW
jgi:hypothetical protein